MTSADIHRHHVVLDVPFERGVHARPCHDLHILALRLQRSNIRLFLTTKVKDHIELKDEEALEGYDGTSYLDLLFNCAPRTQKLSCLIVGPAHTVDSISSKVTQAIHDLIKIWKLDTYLSADTCDVEGYENLLDALDAPRKEKKVE